MTNDAKNIVQLVIKNTSTLDYTMPLLKQIKVNKLPWNITVLYCDIDKRAILRGGKFFSRTFAAHGINERDLSDFFCGPLPSLYKIIARLFNKPNAEFASFDNIKHTEKRLSLTLLSRLILYVGFRLRGLAKHILSMKTKSMDAILDELSPDAILFDNRSIVNFPGARSMYSYLSKANIPVVLLPHAPHYITQNEGFMPYDPHGPKITKFCDVWLPLKSATPELEEPNVQYARIGYPAFDETFIKELNENNGRLKSIPTCLFIGRKFLEPEVKKPDGYDPFTLEYNEVFSQLSLIHKRLISLRAKIHFIFKPHPSCNFKSLEKMVRQIGFTSYEISDEPFYYLMPKLDFCISPFSTSSLIPAMAGVPTLFLNDNLQKYVNSQWAVLRDLYEGLHFFPRSDREFYQNLQAIIENPQERPHAQSDRAHLRKYYPDGAIDRGLSRLQELLSKHASN